MNLPILSARKIAHSPLNLLREHLKGGFILRFDDADIVTNARFTILSWHCWVLHRRYKEIPLYMSHHIHGKIGSKRSPGQIHRFLISDIVKDMDIATYGKFDLREVAKLIYTIPKNIQDDVILNMSEWQTGFDIVDMLQIRDHPDLASVIEQAKPNEEGIRKSYNAFTELMSGKKIKLNPLSGLFQSQLVKTDQMKQIHTHRGYVSDVNGVSFPTPIMTGYLEGIDSLYASMAESRNASISHVNAKDPLETSEFANRRSQINSSVVAGVEAGDCGSNAYLDWVINSSNGKIPTSLLGVNFLDEDLGCVRPINEHDQYLIGRTVKIRNVIAGCKVPSRRQGWVCMTCYGDVGRTVPELTNIGLASTVRLNSPMIQLVISVKHVTKSIEKTLINMTAPASDYLFIGHDQESLYVREQACSDSEDLFVLIPTSCFPSMRFLSEPNDVASQAARLSKIAELTVRRKIKNTSNFSPVEILQTSYGNRISYASDKLISYMKKNQNENCAYVTLSGTEYIQVDLNAWDKSDPVLIIPYRHESMSEYASRIFSLIETSSPKEDSVSRGADLKPIRKKSKALSDPAEVLYRFYDLVDERMTINLSVLSIIVYAYTMIDPSKGDYRLPFEGSSRNVVSLTNAFLYRSLSAALAFQTHTAYAIDNPSCYFGEQRIGHPFDAIVMPEEVAKVLGY